MGAKSNATLKPPKDAQNYAAVANQLDSAALLSKFDFLNIKNGKTQITAATTGFIGGGGGASSLTSKANGTVSLFSAGTNSGQGTVSVAPTAQGFKYFATGNADVSTTTGVSLQGGVAKLKVKQDSSTSNKTLGNAIYNLTPTEWIVIGGAVAAGVLIWFAVK